MWGPFSIFGKLLATFLVGTPRWAEGCGLQQHHWDCNATTYMLIYNSKLSMAFVNHVATEERGALTFYAPNKNPVVINVRCTRFMLGKRDTRNGKSREWNLDVQTMG
ncbi:hypothetical protein ACJJTC_007784 [Scirpophaga incertulas]